MRLDPENVDLLVKEAKAASEDQLTLLACALRAKLEVTEALLSASLKREEELKKEAEGITAHDTPHLLVTKLMAWIGGQLDVKTLDQRLDPSRRYADLLWRLQRDLRELQKSC